MLELAAVVTLRPLALGPEHVERCLSNGVTRGGLEHGLLVASLFNAQNRFVDALGCDLPEDNLPRIGFMLRLPGLTSARVPLGHKTAFAAPDGGPPPALARLLAEMRSAACAAGPELVSAAEATTARQAGGKREPLSLPPPLAAYVDTLAARAADVTDAQMDALRTQFGEEVVFDVTMAASVGAMAGRIERAWALVPSHQAGEPEVFENRTR